MSPRCVASDAAPAGGAVQALPVAIEGGTMSRTGAAPSSAWRSTDASLAGGAPRSTAIASCSRPWRVSRRASIMSTLGRIITDHLLENSVE